MPCVVPSITGFRSLSTQSDINKSYYATLVSSTHVLYALFPIMTVIDLIEAVVYTCHFTELITMAPFF